MSIPSKGNKMPTKENISIFFRSFGARNEITNNFAIKAHVGQSRFGSAFSFLTIELDRRFPLIMMFDKQKGIATPMNYSIWPSDGKLYRTIYMVGQWSFHPTPLKFAPPKMTQNYMKYIIGPMSEHSGHLFFLYKEPITLTISYTP